MVCCMFMNHNQDAESVAHPSNKMRCLDLFSGIGGQALALKWAGIKTIGYCELDKRNVDILRSNMDRGRLDKAPIFPDVAKLTKHDLPKDKGGLPQVDMIAAGFPCVGLSSMGHMKGLYGDHRSNLVKHVFRLVRELKPSYVFLENVPNILRDKHYRDMIRRITHLHYRCAFMVNTASQYGAQHVRARWFMLCKRKGAAPYTPKNRVLKLSRYFGQPVRHNVLSREKYGAWASTICHAFGNSVVPAQSCGALITLAKTLDTPASSLKAVQFNRINRMKPTVALSPTQYYQDENYKVPSMECSGKGFTVIPPTPPLSYTSRMSLPPLKAPFKSLCVPTPGTSNCSSPIPTMTRRTKSMAGNFLLSSPQFWCGKMPNHTARMRSMVSDQYWATTMGFPKDWLRSHLVQHH